MQSHHTPQHTGTIRPSTASRRRRLKSDTSLAVIQALENRLLLSVPPTPTNVADNGLNSCDGFRCQTTLSWSGTYSAGDTARLEVSTDGLNWLEAQTGDATAHQMTVIDLGNVPDLRPTYYFRLRASNTSGYSSYSNVDTLVQDPQPMKPYNVYAEKTGVSGQIHLHWDGTYAGSPTFDVIHIEQSTDDVNFTELTSSSTIAANHQQWINGLNTSQTYYYRLRASNSSGNSAYSQIVSADIAGDGVADDGPGLQSAINKLSDGGTLTLTDGDTYKLNRGLVINKRINVDGNQATILVNTSGAWPEDEVMFFQSKLASTTWSWNESVSEGQTTFNVHIPTSQLQAGDLVYIQLGQDPNDINGEHNNIITTVVSNDGNTVELAEGPPYDINPQPQDGSYHGKAYEFLTSGWNHITKISTLIHDVAIQDLNFNRTNAAKTDIDLWVDRVQNVTIDHVGGLFSSGLEVTNSDDVDVSNISGQVVAANADSVGSIFGSWQSDNTTLSNVNVVTDADKPIFFLESWVRNMTISNVNIDWKYPFWGTGDVFHITGGSYGIELDNITIHNAGPVDVIDSGGQLSDYHIGRIDVDGPITWLALERADETHFSGHVFDIDDILTQHISATDLSTQPASVSLQSGIIRSITINVSSVDGLTIWLMRQRGGTPLTPLQAGTPLTFYPGMGLDAADDPLKYLSFTYGPSFSGATITVDTEYWAPTTQTPQHFAATPVDGSGMTHITWDGTYATSPQDEITLDWSTDGTNWNNHQTTIASSHSAYITGLSTGTTYYIRAHTFNSGQTISSEYTDDVILNPSSTQAPIDVSATKVTSGGSTDIHWRGNFSSSDVVKFEISEDNQNFTEQSVTANAGDMTATLTDLDPFTLYYLRLRTTRSGSADSDYSQTLLLPSQAVPPMKIEKLVASGLNGSNQSHLHWDGAFRSAAYPDSTYDMIHIQYSTDPNFPDTSATQTTNVHADLSEYDLTLSPNTTYYIRVRTYNSFGESWFWSPTVSIHAGGPATPTGISATAIQSNSTTISWSTTPYSSNDTMHVAISWDGFQFFDLDTTALATAGSLTVGGLSPGTYYFRVWDVNSQSGASNYSVAVATS